MYTLTNTNLLTKTDAQLWKLIARDADDASLTERKRHFDAMYALFTLRCEALKNTNVELDNAEAAELRLILEALIQSHQKMCTIKKTCV